MRRSLLLVVLMTLVLACGAASEQPSGSDAPGAPGTSLAPQAPSPSPAPPSAGSAASPASRPSVSPSSSPEDEPTPTPTPAATVSPPPAKLGPDALAVVVTDNLAIRSAPGTGKDSVVEKPYLQPRTRLYVVRGPVRASGYPWYEVMPITSKGGIAEWGWVAAASKEGEPWIKATSEAPTCPDVPRSIADLQRVLPGIALACFRGVPITLDVQMAACGYDMPDAGYEPDMFNGAYDPRAEELSPIILADPGTDPCESDPQFRLFLDPAGPSPASLSFERVARVTGSFDHAAARKCVWTSWLEDSSYADPATCRSRFVVAEVE